MNVIHGVSLLQDEDVYLFREGTHHRLYKKLGSHLIRNDGREGTLFAVWAPNARSVSVAGDFNDWDASSHPLSARWEGSGIWEGFVPGLAAGAHYKYSIVSHDGSSRLKADPFAFFCQTPPRTASIVWNPDYQWTDGAWMEGRGPKNGLDAPMSVYEVHLGSWRRAEPEQGYGSLSYRELGQQLVDYVADMGFTHVEFLPIMEHPFFGSWGYQMTGFFAPSGRQGLPEDAMHLIDRFHERGIGVILDWVPSHFPFDDHGLAAFDGSCLFEHEDPRQGYHPDWKSAVFNLGRNEVRAFLISSALYWLDRYHIDGLRVDAVASMLYLDYSREEGEWVPNRHGGHENLEAIDFLRLLNQAVYGSYPSVQTIAEESTDWPMVSRPAHDGGLGFGLKWKMGWMHDTLQYFALDPIHRKDNHDKITFGIWYAFHENYLLPLSHDEVVHGKGSLLAKMAGDPWQKFANLRLLYGFMYSHPGKKLLFMGSEWGQMAEWNHDSALDWPLLEHPRHKGVQDWVRDLNRCYRKQPALHQIDFENEGYEWIDLLDRDNSVVSYLRRGRDPGDLIVIVCNFTPVPRLEYLQAVPFEGGWRELLNSDSLRYGGSGVSNGRSVQATGDSRAGQAASVRLNLPPLGVLFLEPVRPSDAVPVQQSAGDQTSND